ncbi:FG-GAP repeat domain-containing protein [Metarhizium album ARSEF 1941]|uniref:FG-GAP repeat domain-containing protein n=1 Tax=Metarhizium album (strain ARSEF 1941) TaxID=1081103 RepID=A0A0B2WLY6_METAS|nr:FG-GAP repeat domain-containing protein [Metarhizium album ARSEF 1941]KHN94030.1 FG-GAP repeat domain-containing protein [Metarhizium album ARSEF 1941]
MPLGDSITFGTGGSDLGSYRKPLLPMLHGLGHDVDFVGPVLAGSNSGDPDNAGYVGYLVVELRDKIIADQLVAKYKPTYILLHIGSNNMGNDAMASRAPSDLQDLIDDVWKQGPRTSILLAAVIPTRSSEYNKRTALFNRDVRRTAAQLQEQGKPVSLCDLSTAIDPARDLADAVHPNDNGYKKMAAAWLQCLKHVLPPARGKIAQHNPHFQTLHPVPARTFDPGYIPMWESQGITIDFAGRGTDLYAVSPLAGHGGIATTFDVAADKQVTVTFRVRDSPPSPLCPGAAHHLHVASDTDNEGVDIHVPAGDTAWGVHKYKFMAQGNSSHLSFQARGPTDGFCGPSVADVVVRQDSGYDVGRRRVRL